MIGYLTIFNLNLKPVYSIMERRNVYLTFPGVFFDRVNFPSLVRV